MARRRQAPPVADVISSSPSGCDRGPMGTSPARGEIMELNLRKGFLHTRANFNGLALSVERVAGACRRIPTDAWIAHRTGRAAWLVSSGGCGWC